MLKAYVEKLKDSDSDDSKCGISTFEGSESERGISASGDNSDSEDLS